MLHRNRDADAGIWINEIIGYSDGIDYNKREKKNNNLYDGAKI